MTRRAAPNAEALLSALCADSRARLVEGEDGGYSIACSAESRLGSIPPATVRVLVARGLLAEAEGGQLAATPSAAAWLKRKADKDRPFLAQHADLAQVSIDGGAREALANLEESPIAALARAHLPRSAGSGRKAAEPWLSAHAVTAAERLRRDFEVGRLQPRVTANWSASVSDGRRTGDNTGIADLTDMALAARLRFDRAVQAVGPELSGVLVDVCCFLKGLQTVERERQWPARSAKLVLRLALERLASHYGLTQTATGRAGSRRVHHWGAEDFRPKIS